MSELQGQNKPVTVSLDVVWQGSAGKHDARMSEISMDGCFIDSRVQGRSLGDLVEFKVHLPNGPWVSLQGELVVQDYPMGFGLRFRNLTEADRRLLRRVVAAHGGLPAEESVEDSAVTEPPATAAATPEDATAVPVEADKHRGRVLIAEDDGLTLRMLTAIVQSEGYEAAAVKDGREALSVLQQDADFKLAIFDMKMPYLEGLDLILYMKRDQRLRHIPIGMVTAERDPKIWDETVAAGASVFLPKPFSPPQVQMMLRMLESRAGA